MITVVVSVLFGHPKIFSIPTNNISKDKPITTSGITRGAVIAPKNSVFPRNILNLVITMAAIVPSTIDTVADKLAIFKLVNVALSRI
jgi:hypothetical protein